MAFANSTNWVVWSTGNAANGGGFNPANANFSANGSITGATGNSPVLSSSDYNFGANDVGHWVFFPLIGTSIGGWYLGVSAAANALTLSAAVGAAQILGAAGQTGYSGSAPPTVVNAQVGVAGGVETNQPIGWNGTAGCNTQASPTGVTWGIDYSQNVSARYAFTDMVIGVTTTDFTSVANPVGVNMLGNIINVVSGTGFTVQRVEVVSISAAVTGRCDKSLGTTASTGGNGNLGGATAILTTTSGLFLAGNYCKLKATGTYTLGATWTIGAGVKGDTTNGKITLEGYTTIPGARDGRPTITTASGAGANSVHLITLNDNDFWEFKYLKMTHNATVRGAAFTTITSVSTPLWFKGLVIGTIAGSDACLAMFNTLALSVNVFLEAIEIAGATSAVSAVTNVANAASNSQLLMSGCYVHDSTASVYKQGNANATVSAQDSIFAVNVGVFDFSSQTSASANITSHYCTYVGNTGDCIKLPNTSSTITLELQSNIAYGTTGWFVNNAQAMQNTDQQTRLNRNNFLGSNSSGNYSGLTPGYGDVALGANNPFVNSAGRNYAIDPNSVGGALIKAKAFPIAWGGVPDTMNYRSGGAAQPQDSPLPMMPIIVQQQAYPLDY